MMNRPGGTATTLAGLSLVLVSACSVGANGPDPAPGPLGSSTSPSSNRAPVPATSGPWATPSTPSSPTGSTTSPSPTTSPEFSPASIIVTSKLARPDEVVLRVEAPRHTSFRIGQSLTASVPCGSAPIAGGDPVTYGVVCPGGGNGAKLVATIAYQDFDFTFVKVL